MIVGAHSIIYSRNPEADRAFLRDMLGLPHVDVGEGWLIFGLPPSEVAVHPSEENGVHEFFFMCEDVGAFVERMSGQGIACGPVQQMGWGMLTRVTLPGGGELGVYQPRHARPRPVGFEASRPASAPRAARTAARQTSRESSRRTARKSPRRASRRPKASSRKSSKRKSRR